MEKKTIILVIEDDKAISVLTCCLLQDAGFATMPAYYGGVGLRLAQQSAPDVILLDLMLPDIIGFEVCEQLKQNPLTNWIPVVMCTAMADDESRQRGMECGAFAYLIKPYNPDTLVDMVRNLAA
jgi:DNA-binding response OmpR family regulator